MLQKFNKTKELINDLPTLKKYLSYLICEVRKDYETLSEKEKEVMINLIRETLHEHYEDLYYQFETEKLYNSCFDDFIDIECGLINFIKI